MAHDLLIQWLDNAHAMERAILQILDEHIDDAEEHEDIAARLQEHRDTTESQAERLEELLSQMDAEPSSTKEYIADMMGAIQGKATMGVGKIVKNAIADYAVEHYEIATYQAIMKLAEDLGENSVVNMVEAILQEEQDMAQWLQDSLPQAVEMTHKTST